MPRGGQAFERASVRAMATEPVGLLLAPPGAQTAQVRKYASIPALWTPAPFDSHSIWIALYSSRVPDTRAEAGAPVWPMTQRALESPSYDTVSSFDSGVLTINVAPSSSRRITSAGTTSVSTEVRVCSTSVRQAA